jgi:hypothetical protein
VAVWWAVAASGLTRGRPTGVLYAKRVQKDSAAGADLAGMV